MADFLSDAFWQEFQGQIDDLRAQLLAKGGFSPSRPSRGLPDFQSQAKNRALFLYFLALEKREKIRTERRIAEYYATDVPEARSEDLESSGIVVDSLQEGEINEGFEQDQPQANEKPSYVQEHLEKAIETQRIKQSWNSWKTELTPFIGQQRSNRFPGETELPHQRDDTVGNMIEYQPSPAPPNNPPNHKLFKAWIPASNGRTKGGTPSEPMSEKINEMLKDYPPGAYKFFIEKLHGYGSRGPFKKNAINPGAQPWEVPNRMLFPAYVESFNDSFDLSWDSYKFSGRGEPTYVWSQTERTLTLSFYVISDFSSELLINAAKALQSQQQSDNNTLSSSLGEGAQAFAGKNDSLSDTAFGAKSIGPGDGSTYEAGKRPLNEQDHVENLDFAIPDWGAGNYPQSIVSTNGKSGYVPGIFSGTPEQLYNRATFLSQCCYGWYRKDGKLKEQPMIRLRITDFLDLVCKVNSMQINMDEFDIDLNQTTVGNIPMAFKCTLNLTVIHEDEPSSEYRKFYHRRDRDQDVKAGENSALETSVFKDSTLDANQSKSPLSQRPLGNNKERLSMPTDALLFLEALQKNSISLGELEQQPRDLQKTASKEKLRRALKNAQELAEVQSRQDRTVVRDISSSSVTSSSSTGGILTPDKQLTQTSLSNTPVEVDSSSLVQKQTPIETKPKPLFPKFRKKGAE